MATTEKAPQFAPLAETLLGTRAFYDDERTQALNDGTLAFTAESAGMRGLLYVRALRLVAQAKQESFNPEYPWRPLTMAQLGKFALEHMPQVLEVSRPLAILNNAERALHEADILEGLHSHQHPYLHDLVDFMNIPPSHVTAKIYDETLSCRIQGATVEAPTGIGKTVLIARTLVALGVGKPLDTVEHDKSRVRALIIVPSQTLVEQMIGKVGDDTLRSFAPGISVGGYYQHEKDLDADTVVITIDQFIEEFRDGMLRGQRFDVCIIDEAHHATEPQFQRALMQHWRGGPVIGFTATPAYFPGKDVRDLLTHRIFHGDMLDFIEKDGEVLNAAQLFMIRAEYDLYLRGELLKSAEGKKPRDVDQLVTREAMAEWLMPQVAEGRRGIIFCEQGGGEPSHYALLMAERLRQLQRPDGSPLRVAVAGTLNASKSVDNPDSNAGIRRRYAADESDPDRLDYIVTVEWGREGLNEDIDTVGVAGNVTSALKFIQQIGRGTRLSKRFPVTTYGHIFVPSRRPNAKSLFGVLGLEDVEQGQGLVFGKAGQHDGQSGQGARASRVTGSIPLEAFPERIQAIIASMQAKTVAEALFDSEVKTVIPKGYKEFALIMDGVPGPQVSIRRYLRDVRGFACVGRYEYRGGVRGFYFYFEEAAEAYLDGFRGCVARVDLQRQFGDVDVSVVESLANSCKVEPIEWMYSHGQFIPHYKKVDAEKIVEAFNATPQAAPTDYSRVRLAKEANTPEAGLMQRLTKAERGRIVPRRTTTANGKIRVLDHWVEADAKPIIERLKQVAELKGSIPVHLVPQELAMRHVRAQKRTLSDFADSIGDPSQLARIAGSGRPPRCITWKVLEAAEAHFGLRHNSFTINYRNLPNTFAETCQDPKKDYAIEILKRLEGLPSKFGHKSKWEGA